MGYGEEENEPAYQVDLRQLLIVECENGNKLTHDLKPEDNANPHWSGNG